ncbi:exonuclease domain-containing protein [Streptomyces sp. NRRL F-525]|uniref:exonuclease domain-containing protein n=1 Tax=Streptomyces sp. NRRL F-525 TaxID=1463861 RepID=UPI001F29A095|nr:exonuclease domain-containing protein [Streptomyces sp. NRRL F-525]
MQLAERRRSAVAWVEKVTVCPGDGYGAGCSVKLVTKSEARAYQKDQGKERDWWMRAPQWPDRCPPCAAVKELRDAEERAKYQAEREERQKRLREAERLAAERRERWAAAALADPNVVVLDTETTGLHGEARIVEIGVLSSGGEVLLDTLLNPGEPIPADATELHGITDSMVSSAPVFGDVLVRLGELLGGKRVLIYNDEFDVGRLRHELTLYYLDCSAGEATEDEAAAWARGQATAWLDAVHCEDVMIPYSDWVGDWSEYHGNNTWQPLNGGHRAVGDCRAVLDCLRSMGRRYAAEYEAMAAGGGGLDEKGVG